MIIDIHLHVKMGGISAEGLLAYMNQNRVDLAWVLTWEQSAPGRWPYQHLSIEDVYDLYSRYPERIIPMYAPDPLDEAAVEKLTLWHSRGIKGCAELKSAIIWADERCLRMLQKVDDLGIPLLFHMEESMDYPAPLPNDGLMAKAAVKLVRTNRWQGFFRRCAQVLASHIGPLEKWRQDRMIHFPGYLHDFDGLEKALDMFPRVKFIGHGPKFWKYISADARPGEPYYPNGPVHPAGQTVRLMREHPNLYADISGGSGFNAISRDRSFSTRFFQEFADRILFGSDNCRLGQIEFLKSLVSDKAILNKVLGENASNLVPV